jgi:hypothetical protein
MSGNPTEKNLLNTSPFDGRKDAWRLFAATSYGKSAPQKTIK